MAATVRREVDSLDQKIKEDIQTLKHEYVLPYIQDQSCIVEV
jgi:hypothetical protein